MFSRDFALDQDLRTTDSPTFAALTLNGAITATDVFLSAAGDLDMSAAGALEIGPATATSVALGNIGAPVSVLDTTAAVSTVTGALVVAGGAGISGATWTASARTDLVDAQAANTISLGTVTAADVLIGRAGRLTQVDGWLDIVNICQGIGGVLDSRLYWDRLDTYDATTLQLGEGIATKVEIADAGIVTEVQGPVTVEGSIDTIVAATLTLGPATATRVEIGDAGVPVDLEGYVEVGQPAGLHAEAPSYAAGAGLLTTPMTPLLAWAELVDVSGFWTLAAGLVQYTGATSRYFIVQFTDILIGTVAAGTSSLSLRKDVAGNGVFTQINNNLNRTSFQAVNALHGVNLVVVTLMNTNDRLQLWLSANNDAVSVTFDGYASITITQIL